MDEIGCISFFNYTLDPKNQHSLLKTMSMKYTKEGRLILAIIDGVGARVGQRLRKPLLALVVEVEKAMSSCRHDCSFIVLFCCVSFFSGRQTHMPVRKMTINLGSGKPT